MSAAALALLLTASALADLPEEQRWTGSDRVVVGLNADGSLVNPTLELGLLWDPDGPQGHEPLATDWLLAGNLFETWALQHSSGDLVCGGPHLGSDLVLDWEPEGMSEAMAWMEGWGATHEVEVFTSVQAPWTQDVLWLDLHLTALVDLEDLWVARSVDPDPDSDVLGSYSTANRAQDDWATATSAWDGRTLALASPGGQARLCSWCALPADVLAADPGERTGDDQLAVAVEVGDLTAGETVVVRFAYGFGYSSEQASAVVLDALSTHDRDLDGVGRSQDCDDRDPSVAPGLPEWADGLDNDCDGTVDEDTWLSDDDGDHWTEAEGDCDDADPLAHPGAAPAEGVVDADCDGVADDGQWPPEGVAFDYDEDHPSTGFCGTSPGGLWWWSPLLLVLLRRRP